MLRLDLGGRTYDLTHRALLMGILNRTPDSFYDRGATYGLDALLARAEQLVADGADILDVGGVKAGPGPEVTEPEELDRVIPAIEALARRFDVPVSVDTWRASVARAAYAAGAVMGNDISGFADPDYLAEAARAGAAVVATHIRLAPRVADPEPHYDDVVVDVADFLADRARRALDAGIPAGRIVLDAGLDLGKTAGQSLALLRASDRLAALGHPLLLSASNKTFLGVLLDLEITERRSASLAAAALGVSLGCRLLRVHDVAGTRRVRDALTAVLTAGVGQGPHASEEPGLGRPGGPKGTAGVGQGPHASEEPGLGCPGGPKGTAGVGQGPHASEEPGLGCPGGPKGTAGVGQGPHASEEPGLGRPGGPKGTAGVGQGPHASEEPGLGCPGGPKGTAGVGQGPHASEEPGLGRPGGPKGTVV